MEEVKKTSAQSGDTKKEATETPVEGVASPRVGSDEASETAAVKKAKKSKRQVLKGRVSIQCTYNNTIITIADLNGAVLGWSSSGHLSFKGAKKSTPYAATQVVADVSEKVKKYGIQELEVFVKGVGSGREASIRALANNGFNLIGIKDITPIPHNGCRPRRPRRI
jgi:small subunit ribosomal protein S11